jgi:hypothetical protein
MNTRLATGVALLAAAGLALTGCGGDSAPTAATTAPAATAAAAPAAKPDVVVPPSGAAQSLTVNVGDTFTVWLNVSPRQARAKLPVVGWARDEDAATALTTEGPAETVPRGKVGLQTRFQFTATTAGSADMGFRQATSVQSGITPLAKTAVVHLTVN